jgi:hypothetical protein
VAIQLNREGTAKHPEVSADTEYWPLGTEKVGWGEYGGELAGGLDEAVGLGGVDEETGAVGEEEFVASEVGMELGVTVPFAGKVELGEEVALLGGEVEFPGGRVELPCGAEVLPVGGGDVEFVGLLVLLGGGVGAAVTGAVVFGPAVAVGEEEGVGL